MFTNTFKEYWVYFREHFLLRIAQITFPPFCAYDRKIPMMIMMFAMIIMVVNLMIMMTKMTKKTYKYKGFG